MLKGSFCTYNFKHSWEAVSAYTEVWANSGGEGDSSITDMF